MLHLLSLALAAPVAVPVHGHLTGADGAPLNGVHALTFAVHADPGAAPVWSLTAAVAVHDGAFAAILQGGAPVLDDALIHNAAALWLAVAIDGGPASAPSPVGAVTYAVSAARARVADTLGALGPDDLITWDDLGDGLSNQGGLLVADVDAASLESSFDLRYLQPGDADYRYLQLTDAAATYLTQSDAATEYVSQAAASGFLTAEDDPAVGAVNNGKWCRAVGGQVVCDMDPISATGGSMIAGWPDVIVCDHGNVGEYDDWALQYYYTYAGRRYYGNNTFYLVFNADGSWYTSGGFGGGNPLPNCINRSISQLAAAGQTYNTVGGGLPNPPTCTGSGKALQWTGAAWVCSTTAVENRSLNTSSTLDFSLSSYAGITAGTSRIEGIVDCSPAGWSCRKNGLFQFYNAANTLVETTPLTEYCDTGSGSDPQVLVRTINRVIPASTTRIRMWAAGSGGGACGAVNFTMKLVP